MKSSTPSEVRDHRKIGCFIVERSLYRYYAKRIGPNGILLLSDLASYTNQVYTCFPGIEKLAADTGLSVSTVRRTLKKLEAEGCLQIHPRHDADGRQTSNLYTLLPLSGEGVPVEGGGCQGDTPPCQADGGEGVRVTGTRVSQGHPNDYQRNDIQKNVCVARKPSEPAPLHTHAETPTSHPLIEALSRLTREPRTPQFNTTLFYLQGQAATAEQVEGFSHWFKSVHLRGREAPDPPTTRQVHQLWLRYTDWMAQAERREARRQADFTQAPRETDAEREERQQRNAIGRAEAARVWQSLWARKNAEAASG